MNSELIAVLLRELLADPEAVAALREALNTEGASTEPAPGYTVARLGQTIGLSEKAIRNAITRGELRARKRGGRWMVTTEDVQAWLGPPQPSANDSRRRSPRPRPLGSAFDGLEGWK